MDEELRKLLNHLTIYGDSEIFDVRIWPIIKNNREATIALMREIAMKTVNGCIKTLVENGYRRPTTHSNELPAGWPTINDILEILHKRVNKPTQYGDKWFPLSDEEKAKEIHAAYGENKMNADWLIGKEDKIARKRRESREKVIEDKVREWLEAQPYESFHDKKVWEDYFVRYMTLIVSIEVEGEIYGKK